MTNISINFILGERKARRINIKNGFSILTNYYSKVKDLKSEVHFQLWNEAEYQVKSIDDRQIRVFFFRSKLNFVDETRNVYDGLINYINIKQLDGDVMADIFTQFDSRYDVITGNLIPFTLTISLDRTPLMEFFQGRWIRIISSKEIHMSPTKLVEKVVMEKIANRIRNLLKQYGCGVATESDVIKADLNIYMALLHEDVDFSGYCVRYDCVECQKGAEEIYKGLKQKLPLDDHGCVYKDSERGEPKGFIKVYLGNINNRIDDAHLRSTDYIDKAIEGIFNGLLAYFKGSLDTSDGKNRKQKLIII